MSEFQVDKHQNTDAELVKPTKVDLNTPEADEAFAAAPVYEKFAVVQASQATQETPITTVLADGTVETSNVAQPGDYIVTNPGGEQYVVEQEKFEARYEVTEDSGTFKAKGIVKAVANATGTPVTVIAPWGEEQHGNADCIYLAQYDPSTGEISEDRYIIGRDEFNDTYRQRN